VAVILSAKKEASIKIKSHIFENKSIKKQNGVDLAIIKVYTFIQIGRKPKRARKTTNQKGRTMKTEKTISKNTARIYQVKRNTPNENMIRLYKSSPDGLTFQIRTHKPITEAGNGTPRDMIASVPITLEEIKALYEYALEAMSPAAVIRKNGLSIEESVHIAQTIWASTNYFLDNIDTPSKLENLKDEYKELFPSVSIQNIRDGVSLLTDKERALLLDNLERLHPAVYDLLGQLEYSQLHKTIEKVILR